MEELLKKIVLEAMQEALGQAQNTEQQNNEIMTRQQLAEYLQVSVPWVDKNIRNIPHLKVAGTRFRRADIDAWLEDKLEEPSITASRISIKGNNKANTYKVV